MALTYTGRLTGQILKGVQVAIFNAVTGVKVDSTTSDVDGVYAFNGLKQGVYILRKYGGGYDSNVTETVTIAEDGSNRTFYIRALEGTTIKNSSGVLSADIIKSESGVISEVTDGTAKLYYKDAGEFKLITTKAGVSGTDYSADISAYAITGTLNLYLVEHAGLEAEVIYQSLSFTDVSDGSQGPGVLYIGEFDTLNSNRELKNNGIARDVVSVGGTYFAFTGLHLTSVATAGSPADELTTATY